MLTLGEAACSLTDRLSPLSDMSCLLREGRGFFFENEDLQYAAQQVTFGPP